jgi:hypothetical protein
VTWPPLAATPLIVSSVCSSDAAGIRRLKTSSQVRGRIRSSLYPPSIITMHQFLRGGVQPTVRRVNLLDVFTRHLKTYYGSGMICGA